MDVDKESKWATRKILEIMDNNKEKSAAMDLLEFMAEVYREWYRDGYHNCAEYHNLDDKE